MVASALILVGSLLLIAGLAQIIRARLRKAGVVTSGLYSVVRHPQYLGMAMLTLGFALYGRRPIDFIAWVTLVFIQLLLAKSEEGKLQKKFGREYSIYKKRVPFIIPFVPSGVRQRFSSLMPCGWKEKVTVAGAYLLTIAILLITFRLSPLILMR